MTTPSGFVIGFEDILLREAQALATDAIAATVSRDVAAKSFVSILVSVAAFEALVGTWTAIYRHDYKIADQTLAQWRDRPITGVVKDILTRLTPPTTASSCSWYPGLAAIVLLRNHLAHYFPDSRPVGTWPTQLVGLFTSGLLTSGGTDQMDWTSRVLVGPVAQQVVDHAERAFKGFSDVAWHLPDAAA